MRYGMRPAGVAIVALITVVSVSLVASCHSGSGSESALTAAVGPQATGNLIGDLLGTGTPEVGSAINVLRVLVGLDPQPSPADLWQWDCNGSGAVDVADEIGILRAVVALDPWPIGSAHAVGPAGGTLSVAGGVVILVFPVGAVSSDTMVVVRPTTSPPPDPNLIPGTAYDYAPSAMTFSEPVQLTVYYDPSAIPAGLYEGATRLCRWDGVSWVPVPGSSADMLLHAVSASVTSFGCYAAVGGTAPSYEVIDLGSLPHWLKTGARTGACDINASGQVVGYCDASERYLPITRAFLYSGGAMSDLGTLLDPDEYVGGSSEARCINDLGQVVGYSDTAEGNWEEHAFLYSGGTMTDLGVLPGHTRSEATGINASGQVVGYCTTPEGENHAFLYSGGAMSDLGTLPGWTTSQATGINAAGQVVGYGSSAGGETRAFIWSGGTMVDLGTLPGGSESYALGINDSGQVVGYAGTSLGTYHAFLYSGGVMVDLGTLGGNRSEALAINASGQVVGWSYAAIPPYIRAFVFSGGTMFELGSLPDEYDTSTYAYGVNDAGQVVGRCQTPSVPYAVLWQPR